MEKALINAGIDPMIAKELAEKACEPAVDRGIQTVTKPIKKKVSAYARRYKAAFRRIAPTYKLKSGRWRTGGFRKAVKLAHKEARK